MDNAEIVLADSPDTVKVAVAVTWLWSVLPDAMAVMAVVPALTPVTSPSGTPVQAGAGRPWLQIVATDGLLEYQLTV